MKFGLRNGPWKTVFEGLFQGHEIEILINPEQTMLVSIYEKEGQEISGVVLQAFSIFSTVGEAGTFVESLQREAVILSRHDGKHTLQFLGLASEPAYSKAKDEQVAQTVDRLLDQIARSGSKARDVAKSFDLHLTPLSKCSNAVKQAFFSQPTIIPMLVREKRTLELEREEAVVEAGTEGGAVLLGMTKAGKQVKEPLQMFQRTIVSDGTLQQRVQVIQIIVESYLLANVPVIIFDDGNNFSGLGYPTKKIAELQSHGVEGEPIGFPTKDFEPAKNLTVNLNVINPAGLLQLFGCKDEETEKLLGKALKKGVVQGPAQLIDNIDSLDSEEAPNLFLKMRVERIIRLIDMLYPEMFAGQTNVKDIAKSWFEKIGRASIVHVDKMDARALLFLLDSLLNDLVLLFKQQPATRKPKLLIAIPTIKKIFAIRNNVIRKDFVKMLTEMKRVGIGFIIGSERRSDLGKEIRQITETKAGVIKENDVAIDLPNAKNYRILIRPTLSRAKDEK